VLLRLNCHVANLSAFLEISLPYQAVYYYLLDNLVSGPSFVPTVIAALHPSNNQHQARITKKVVLLPAIGDLFAIRKALGYKGIP